VNLLATINPYNLHEVCPRKELFLYTTESSFWVFLIFPGYQLVLFHKYTEFQNLILSGRYMDTCELFHIKYLSLVNLKGRDHLEDLGIDGKIILKWMLGKEGGKMRTGYMWLRIETIGGLL
jgi:hypothetical protein